MAGGGGVEWYFGYQYPHSDLNCEDWRSRELLWDQTRIALEFFHRYLPFDKMECRDDLTEAADDYCFAWVGEVYAVYLPKSHTFPGVFLGGCRSGWTQGRVRGIRRFLPGACCRSSPRSSRAAAATSLSRVTSSG